jgi:hypothetical protein
MAGGKSKFHIALPKPTLLLLSELFDDDAPENEAGESMEKSDPR